MKNILQYFKIIYYFFYRFWFPGPESEFEYQRYYRGFIQLQDSIDKAIIKYFTSKSETVDEEGSTKSSEDAEDENNQLGGTYMQEMPYPCWRNDP